MGRVLQSSLSQGTKPTQAESLCYLEISQRRKREWNRVREPGLTSSV